VKVLVYGGTGSQARPTVQHLLASGHTPHVLTRNPDNASDLQQAGAVLVNADLADFEQLCAASNEVDGVAFLLPTFLDNPDDGIRFGRHAIDAARQAGVDMFVWNASGEIVDDGDAANTKLSILRHLEAAALRYLVLEPTTYMENWLGPWTAPSVRENDELSYPVLEERKIGWIASDDVGALVVAALKRPQLSGRRLSISGLETPTGLELAELFSDACGRYIRYRTMTPEEMGAVLDQEFGPGAGDGVADMYREEQQDPDPPAKYHDMTSVLEALPVKMSTITDWVKAHKHAFVR
jgi:uncharacterized protein YbjT (DUF2867 family)